MKQRLAGVAATIFAELIIIGLLLTLSWNLAQDEPEPPVVTTFEASNASPEPENAPEESPPETTEQQAEPLEQPPDPQPLEAPELPPPTPRLPSPLVIPPPMPVPPLPTPEPSPAPTSAPPRANPSPPRVYGPPSSAPPSFSNDSERVGTAPNGEPLYAARWYREPTRQQLAGYLSTAHAPASALIACRTVPGFYVEDCQLIAERPSGSQIGRAVLAAAWQFRVRPAIIGGQSQVGSWVRIRIDYERAVIR